MADNKRPYTSRAEDVSLEKIYSLLVITERKLRLLENELQSIKQILRKGD